MAEENEESTAWPASWSLGLRALHWLTAALLIYELGIAFYEMRPGINGMLWFPIHASLGFALLALVGVRLVWRSFERRRVFGARFVRGIAAAVHGALYLVLIGVALTGWIAYRPMPLMPVRIFGVVVLPVFPEAASLPPLPYLALHRALTWTLISLLAIHVGAAIFHGIQRDGVMSAMTFRKRPQGLPRRNAR